MLFRQLKKPIPKKTRLQKILLAVTMLLTLATGLVPFMVMSDPPVNVVLIATGLVFLLGLIVFESVGRRSWEKNITDTVEKLSEDIDLSAKEISRNRHDVAALRQELAETGETAALLEKHMLEEPQTENKQGSLRTVLDGLSRIGKPFRRTPTPIETIPEDILEQEDLALEEESEEIEPTLDDLTNEELVEEEAPEYTDTVLEALLDSSIAKNHIEVFTQRAVSLPQRKTKYVEVFARLRARAGTYLSPNKFLKVAEEQEKTQALDNLALLRALDMVRKSHKSYPDMAFFCNITPATLRDKKFMDDLVSFIGQNRDMASRLVFEFSQKDMDTMPPQLVKILDALAELGVRNSVDHVTIPRFDFERMHERHVRFLKLPAGLVLCEIESEEGFIRMQRAMTTMHVLGIELIVEKIEEEKQLLDLFDLNINCGQGFLFGRPHLATGELHRMIA